MDVPLVTHGWIFDEGLMSEQQENDGQSQQPRNLGSHASPEYGLVSRTLVYSSVVKKILPARIRRPELNDVLFIGESFIELHLLTEGGRLRKICTKADFHADIRDAVRVYGSQRTSNMSGVEFLVQQGEAKRRLPAEIVALTLDSGHIAFLYGKDDTDSDHVEFEVSRKRIGLRGIYPTHLGKSVAVDPRSRALVVTAYQDTFRIYSLHPIEELHRQMEASLSLNPIKEEKSFEVRGLILHAEFLYPLPEDQDRVILLLFIIDSNKQSRLQLYEWLTWKPLSTASKCGHHGLRLSEDMSLPMHIIPLVVHSAFLIVTEEATHVVKASDITQGNANFPKIPLPAAGTGNDGSLITAWTRPFRHSDYSLDDMYLALENGDIYFLEIDPGAHTLVHTATKASQLDCAVGTAFAALDYGLGRDDMLVAGGEMSSGGLYMVNVPPAAMSGQARREESVTNWAPVFDFELVNVSAKGQVFGGAERDRVFACTGRGVHGALTELRRGLQARIQAAADYVPGIRRMFILPDASSQGYFILSSLADSSQLCFLSPAAGEWKDCGDEIPAELGEQTLAAGRLRDQGETEGGLDMNEGPRDSDKGRYFIQVTPKAITVAQAHGDVDVLDETDSQKPMRKPKSRKLQQRCKGDDFIIAAAVHPEFLLLAMQSSFGVNLVLASVSVGNNSEHFLSPCGSPIDLQGDPTYVGFLELRSQTLAIVGSSRATIQIFLCDSQTALFPLVERHLWDSSDTMERDLCVCESAVIIATAHVAILLCGLRGGTVLIFDVITSESALEIKRNKAIKFGPIPVQMHVDVRRKDIAFALAGPEIYRFNITGDCFNASQAFFKDCDIDPVILAMAQVDTSPGLENIFVFATKDQIFYADLGSTERICSRRLRLLATPRRVMYYSPLRVFLVACSIPEPAGGQTGCTLKLIDPYTGESRGDDPITDIAKGDFIFGKLGEQIYCLSEWSMQLQGKSYRYIAVGTRFINANAPEHPKGRIIVLSLSAGQSGKIEVKRRFQIMCEGPVYALAAYSPCSIVYCADKKMCLRTLNPETRKLDNIAEIRLRSPAVQISVKEPFIYVSCAADSILVVKYMDSQLTESFSDEVSRNGFHHVQLSDNFIVATDKQSAVVGLWKPDGRGHLESLVTVFEAELPSSISRIRQGHCRPSWAKSRTGIPGLIGDTEAIIASGVNGSFYQLTLVSKEVLGVLRHVQDVYLMRTGVVGQPLHRREVEMEQLRDARAAHVDGDMLARVVSLGSMWLNQSASALNRSGMIDDATIRQFVDTAVRLLALSRGSSDASVYGAVIPYIDMLLRDAVL